MSNESQKGARELEIFATFMRAASISIKPESITKREPPEPDILCQTLDGCQIAFELVELCDPNLASAFANPTLPKNAYVRTTDPTDFNIGKKLGRTYATQHPIELLCYTDGRIGTPTSLIIPVAVRCLQSSANNFRKAWLLCRGQVHVLWG